MKEYAGMVRQRMLDHLPAHLLEGVPEGGKRGRSPMLRRLEDQFPDGCCPATQRLKGTLPNRPIVYRAGRAITSSQAMCISYFKQFFVDERYEGYLARILQEMGIGLDQSCFSDAGVSCCLNPEEGTIFDFYLRQSSGRRLFWTVRFTEPSFGTLPRLRGGGQGHVRAWEQVCVPLLGRCVYYGLPDVLCEEYLCLDSGSLRPDCPRWRECPIYEFHQYPRIWRSILYAHRQEDHILFLSPLENGALEGERAYIRAFAGQWGTGSIRTLHWEQLIGVTLQTVREEQPLLDYYTAWKNRYFG